MLRAVFQKRTKKRKPIESKVVWPLGPFSLTASHSLIHIHSYTNAYSHSLINTHTHTFINAHIYPLTAVTRIHTPNHNSYTLAHTHNRTHFHAHSQSHSLHYHSYALPDLHRQITLKHTNTQIHTYSRTHSYTLTHTHCILIT